MKTTATCQAWPKRSTPIRRFPQIKWACQMRGNDSIPELIHCRPFCWPCASCNPLYTTRQPLFTLSNRLCVSCRPLLVLRNRPCSLPSPVFTLRNPLFTLHNRLCVTLIPFPALRNSVRAPHKPALTSLFSQKKLLPKNHNKIASFGFNLISFSK